MILDPEKRKREIAKYRLTLLDAFNSFARTKQRQMQDAAMIADEVRTKFEEEDEKKKRK